MGKEFFKKIIVAINGSESSIRAASQVLRRRPPPRRSLRRNWQQKVKRCLLKMPRRKLPNLPQKRNRHNCWHSKRRTPSRSLSPYLPTPLWFSPTERRQSASSYLQKTKTAHSLNHHVCIKSQFLTLKHNLGSDYTAEECYCELAPDTFGGMNSGGMKSFLRLYESVLSFR